jgi:hypothetical protein
VGAGGARLRPPEQAFIRAPSCHEARSSIGGGIVPLDRPATHNVHVHVHRAREGLRAGEGSAGHERACVPRTDRRVAADARLARRVACGTLERDEVYRIPASRMIMSVAVKRPAGVVRRVALAAELALGTGR